MLHHIPAQHSNNHADVPSHADSTVGLSQSSCFRFLLVSAPATCDEAAASLAVSVSGPRWNANTMYTATNNVHVVYNWKYVAQDCLSIEGRPQNNRICRDAFLLQHLVCHCSQPPFHWIIMYSTLCTSLSAFTGFRLQRFATHRHA